MDDSTAELLSQLSSEHIAVRREAARQLAQHAVAICEAAAELVRALEGAYDDQLMQWVESALEDIEAPPPQQADALGEVVERFLSGAGTPDAAYWAATMLGRIGPGAVAAIPGITSLLERTDQPHVQLKAAWALGKMGPIAKSSLPQLHRAATSEDHRLASFAQQAIEEINR